ncbi:hydrogenase [Methanobacterium sp. CWC-01]|jgi:energy-converting hydrogenase A subunit K|uniref:hydrogenase n=1 Tax=Methanobacterium aridiramus TaxID=2584467 RepID=UPI0025775F1B|nr:hydrogenase [Methanobacterium sp. CWC-01]WJI08720.1 hydrogenase [Methanobacterium sp. CWC-01]
MEKERDILFLTALVAAGATLASGLAASLQWMVVLPLTLGVLILMVLILFQYRKGGIHLSEKLETGAFILVVVFFALSFIYLFKPA